jgi:hypothetical protein
MGTLCNQSTLKPQPSDFSLNGFCSRYPSKDWTLPRDALVTKDRTLRIDGDAAIFKYPCSILEAFLPRIQAGS